jgi:hypothetical protein
MISFCEMLFRNQQIRIMKNVIEEISSNVIIQVEDSDDELGELASASRDLEKSLEKMGNLDFAPEGTQNSGLQPSGSSCIPTTHEAISITVVEGHMRAGYGFPKHPLWIRMEI